MATPEQALSILAKLADELHKRQSDIETLENAYRGEYRLKFASDDFQEFFQDRYSDFTDNWTQVVADAPHERLQITGIRHDGADKGDGDLWVRWLENEADAYSDLAFLDAIVAKRSYALVWGNPSTDEATVTWEHPSQAIVSYDPETRARMAGAKIWCDDDREYATLYLPDEVWKFQRPRANRPSGLIVPGSFAGGWGERRGVDDKAWPLPNPMGVVPLVEFQNKPRLVGEPISDIAGTLSMQHAINLLWAQLFFAADYASFPARVILNAEKPVVPILNADGQVVGERPVELKKFQANRVTWLDDPNAKIGEWRAADLEVWTKVIDKAVGHIAAQTRTPAHYLMSGGTFANISADAMKALETGLVKRTEEKTQHFGRSAREVFRLMALAEGDDAKAASVATGRVLWKDVENRSDAQLTDSLQKKAAIGYPFRYILELDGLSDPEIERVMAMRDAEGTDALMTNLLRPTAGTPTPTPPDAAIGA